MTMAANTTIPIVDFAAWRPGASTKEKKSVAAKLINACRDVGFVYIINHHVASDKLAAAFDMSKKLYNLPKEKKMLAPHPPGFAVHRGYSWPGLEKVSNAMGDEEDKDEEIDKLRSVSDVKESYEIGSEDNKQQPNIWLPEDVLPGFRSFMSDFYWECFRAAENIMSAMALGIGLSDENYFRPAHDGHNNQLRLLHYPPVPAALIEQQKAIRMDAHSDWPSITLLFQDDCGGLQIENPKKKGEFIDVPPLPDAPDALVMNIGDLMMRWSNDTLKSTVHRVNLPPRQDRFTGDDRMTRERYSIPYFVSPKGEHMVECLPSCIDEKHPAKYDPIRWNDYMLMRASMQYQ
ncbi:uncharacterized protein KY384_005718 [Bacidia gigantensis]|uniref:uncharacterized protein n=1 Tax=Bacidia gigantensis TaxID=2732470 RepID=UPI001D0407FC|nr:uncharacterized protein KY384_005718 [Bacidia gigantensis]KAG8529083.1 hypothetical protein KY384_005718 [Bacidia gigantensis]